MEPVLDLATLLLVAWYMYRLVLCTSRLTHCTDQRVPSLFSSQVKAEIRTAKKTARVVEAEREFRDACTQFRQAYAQFQNPGSSSSGARMHDDGGSGSGGNSDSMSGQHPSGASEQSLTLLMESEDVDALLEAENREDALRLARDTAILRETMADAVDLIEEGGEQLLEVDNTMESATRDAESAAVELTKAREHQKATQKLKIIIGSICACIILCVIVIPLVMKFGTAPGSNPLNPSTELTGFLIQQSSTPSTCSTNSATMCLYVQCCACSQGLPYSVARPPSTHG